MLEVMIMSLQAVGYIVFLHNSYFDDLLTALHPCMQQYSCTSEHSVAFHF